MARKYGQKLGSGGVAYDSTIGIVNTQRMREERLAKAKAALKKNGIAAALLFRTENIRYVTSSIYCPFIDRLSYALAFAEHEPLYYTPSGNPMGDAPWLQPEQRKQSLQIASQAPGPTAVAATAKRFAAGIKEELKKKGLDKEPLGIDDIDEASREALVNAGIKLVNVMPTMLEARAIKTQDEINCLHMVSAICDSAHYAMYQALKPGVRERDIKAIGTEALYRLGVDSIWSILVSAGGMIGGLSMDTDKIIQPGDFVTIDIVRATYQGYTSCYYRNYKMCKQPSQREKDLHKASYDRMYKVIDAIKPGVSTADLAKNWIPCKEKGFPSEEYMWCDDLAHGLGLWLYEYPIINRLWSLEHPMIVEKNMTMAIEAMEFDPMVGRTKLEEMGVVTDDGFEIFTKMPVEDIMIASPIVTAPTR